MEQTQGEQGFLYPGGLGSRLGALAILTIPFTPWGIQGLVIFCHPRVPTAQIGPFALT